MFTFQVVDSYELLQEYFKFRYKVIKEDKNPYFIEDNDDEIDIDEYDKYSIHVVALDEQCSICATARLIIDSPIGYPTPNKMEVNLSYADLNRNSFCEISRIFISPDIRGVDNATLIIRNFIQLISCQGITKEVDYIYAALENNFLRLLRRININFNIIGQLSDYHGLRYPCILLRNKLADDNEHLLKN